MRIVRVILTTEESRLGGFLRIPAQMALFPNCAESRRNPLRSAKRVRSQLHSLRQAADKSIILQNNSLLVPPPDDWSLWCAACGLAMFQIERELRTKAQTCIAASAQPTARLFGGSVAANTLWMRKKSARAGLPLAHTVHTQTKLQSK